MCLVCAKQPTERNESGTSNENSLENFPEEIRGNYGSYGFMETN